MRRIVVVSQVSVPERQRIEDTFCSAEVGFLCGWEAFLGSLLFRDAVWQHKPVDVLFVDLEKLGVQVSEATPTAVSIIGTAAAEGLAGKVVVASTSATVMADFVAFVREVTKAERLGKWWSSSKCGKRCSLYQQNDLLCWTVPPSLPPPEGVPPCERVVLWTDVFIHLQEAGGFWRLNP